MIPVAPGGIGAVQCCEFYIVPAGRRVASFSASDMTAVRWGFDGVFPFISLIFFSLLTKPSELDRADRLFAKMRTPVADTPEDNVTGAVELHRPVPI